jgi:two-component system response regulator HydG
MNATPEPSPTAPSHAGTVLVVDDDVDAAEAVAESLRARGLRAIAEANPHEALSDAMKDDLDVVVTDLQIRSLDGLELCQRIAKARPDLPVVVMTGHASIDAAVGALRAGAFDFIVKPVDGELLALTVARAVQHHRLASEVHRLRTVVASNERAGRLLGESPAMKRVYDVIRRIAPTEATVLVTGESGTGKELVARAIHEHSARSDGPFIAINCAAVPATLLESELFGHAKGAFTDAKAARRGLFLEAQGGTLFLDEIGEMPLEMQVKLLRALQERKVRSVGGLQELPVDVRIVAATNRDLAAMVKEKGFREDLYYRLNVLRIHLPSLAERREDLETLVEHFRLRFTDEQGKPNLSFSPEAMRVMLRYAWPGNVRELENAVERAVTLAQTVIHVEDLPPELVGEPGRAASSEPLVLPADGIDMEATLERIERSLIRQALERANGVRTQAAKVLGLSFRSLRYRLQKLGMAQGEPEEGGDA